jgi:hypothetical protein
MTIQNQLNKFQQEAETILEQLKSVPPNLSQQYEWVSPELDPCIDEIRASAEKIIKQASSPVKIGVVGEFASGKTLLIGSLLGYADALPIGSDATTGNITAINLVQQEDNQTTNLAKFTVEYLSDREVKECVNYILKEAEKRLKDINKLDDQVRNQFNAVKISWKTGAIQNILDWCKLAWEGTGNIELRYLLRELVWLLNTYKSYGKAFCGSGHSWEIDRSIVKHALQLPYQPLDIQNLTFDRLPTSPVPLSDSPKSLNDHLLKNSFPLIRCIKIEVKICKQIWDLGGASKFTLLDFPGLGSANSGVRDTYLSLRELAEIQTILILLDGRKPGGETANRLFTMMQKHKGEEIKDRILVAVGRFDELSLDNPQVVDQLINLDDDPFSESELTEDYILSKKLTVLRTTIGSAKAFTNKPERIVFCSPLLALDHLHRKFSSINVGSPSFIESKFSDPNALTQSKRMLEKWQKMSEKLQQSDPKSHLAKLLQDFAESQAGVGRLRKLILAHVAEHGLKQIYQDTERSFEEVKQKKQELKRILTRIEQEKDLVISESPNLPILRQTLQEVIQIYDKFQEKLDQTPLQNRQGLTIEQVVKKQVISHIYGWSEWSSLFTIFTRAKNGTLENTQSKIDSPFIPPTVKNFPKSTEDFYKNFANTMKTCLDLIKSNFQESIQYLLEELSLELEKSHQILKNMISAKMDSINQEFGENEGTQVSSIFEAVEPDKNLRKYFDERLNNLINHPSFDRLAEKPELVFPFALSGEQGKISKTLDWGLEKPQKSGRHHVEILRLRQEMVNSMTLNLVQLVSQTNKQLNNALIEEILAPLKSYHFEEVLNNDALLRYIADGETTQEQEIPTWFKNLHNIAQKQT